MAHVLVVERDPTIRRAMTVSLALDDHEVEAAPDLSRGIELLEQRHFDLALTELPSPTFSSEALHALDTFTRAAPKTPIVVTTADDQATTLEPTSYGLAAILIKPFHVDTLRACVQRVTEEQAQRSTVLWARAEQSLGKLPMSGERTATSVDLIVSTLQNETALLIVEASSIYEHVQAEKFAAPLAELNATIELLSRVRALRQEAHEIAVAVAALRTPPDSPHPEPST